MLFAVDEVTQRCSHAQYRWQESNQSLYRARSSLWCTWMEEHMSGKCAMQGLSQDSEDQRYVHTYHEGNHESHQSCSRMHKYTNLYPYACVTGRQYIGGAYNICMFVYIYLLIYSYIYTHKYAGANAAMLPGFQPLAIHKDYATAAMHFLRQRMRQRMHDESLLYYIYFDMIQIVLDQPPTAMLLYVPLRNCHPPANKHLWSHSGWFLLPETSLHNTDWHESIRQLISIPICL